ncbi:MAG: GNAT family N-acetyltransferase [candidate division Zixibacteria bacterium]|nr:GNAT family N-acetyltransferase [candidate division Zixibacteria bacterium]
MSGSDITYRNEIPDKTGFFELFETTGWNVDYQVDPDELYLVLKNSWHVISAYENERLVGFGRIVSDGLLHAVIFDIIVLPRYQNRGIGKTITLDLVEICKAHKIRDIQLFCARGKEAFYEKCGFSRRPDDGPGMEIKMKYELL